MTEYQTYKIQVTMEIIAPDYEEAFDYIDGMLMRRYKHGYASKQEKGVTRLSNWYMKEEKE